MTYNTPRLMFVGATGTLVRGDSQQQPDSGSPGKPGNNGDDLQGIDE